MIPRQHSIIFRSYRTIVTGGWPLTCPRCGKASDNWTAYEMPSGSQEMSEAQERLRLGGPNTFYYFQPNDFRCSFPACGHQEMVPFGAVVRFYGFY